MLVIRNARFIVPLRESVPFVLASSEKSGLGELALALALPLAKLLMLGLLLLRFIAILILPKLVLFLSVFSLCTPGRDTLTSSAMGVEGPESAVEVEMIRVNVALRWLQQPARQAISGGCTQAGLEDEVGLVIWLETASVDGSFNGIPSSMPSALSASELFWRRASGRVWDITIVSRFESFIPSIRTLLEPKTSS